MKYILSFILLLLAIVPAHAQNRAGEKVGPNLEIWLPPDFRTGTGPWPLVLFSHGFGGCGKQSAFLTAYLAENGYIVAAPDHADARPCKSLRAFEMQKDMLERVPEKPFRQPERWNDDTYLSRRDDLTLALKAILDDPQFKGYVDEERIALIGHSLGGYAALGLAGAWKSWKDPRFKAVVALSPYTAPFVDAHSLKGISVPVLYIGGSRDIPVTPMLKASNGAYAQTNAPKYFMELEGAGHFSFTQRDNRFWDRIDKTTLAFLDTYLKGDVKEINPGKRAVGVSTYWEMPKDVEKN